MANSLFSASAARKRILETPLEDQMDEIRSEIAALTKLLSKRGKQASKELQSRANDARSKAYDVRDSAEDSLHDLVEAGEQLVSDLRDRYSATEKQLRQTVRQHPLATLGAAAAVGIIVASLFRR